jgi:hypothetical protein
VRLPVGEALSGCSDETVPIADTPLVTEVPRPQLEQRADGVRKSGPDDRLGSELNNGGSSQQAAMTWPGFAYADSHELTRPPDDCPLTTA